MKKIDLNKFYPEQYHTYTEFCVSENIFNALEDFRRADEANRKKRHRNGDIYSLDANDGIESAISTEIPNTEEIVEQKWLYEQLYHALSLLSRKQLKRIIAHYFDGMSKAEIARLEGVSEGAIRHSIEQGLIELKKFFEEIF